MDSRSILRSIGRSWSDTQQILCICVGNLRPIPPSILQNSHNVNGLSRVRQAAGSLKYPPILGKFKIVCLHLLSHCRKASSVYT